MEKISRISVRLGEVGGPGRGPSPHTFLPYLRPTLDETPGFCRTSQPPEALQSISSLRNQREARSIQLPSILPPWPISSRDSAGPESFSLMHRGRQIKLGAPVAQEELLPRRAGGLAPCWELYDTQTSPMHSPGRQQHRSWHSLAQNLLMYPVAFGGQRALGDLASGLPLPA